MNVTKISQKMRDYRMRKIQNEKKHFILIIRKYINLENFVSL